MITKRYTNQRYYEEIKGIAKGAGMDPKEISRLNIFPELIKAACTVAGVWGKASLNQKTLHMRALDWDSKNPISKFPVVTIYHPSNKALHTHANFAWVGFVGSLTGMS
jgi:isopenicillin-N N-acyltransferase-like protein